MYQYWTEYLDFLPGLSRQDCTGAQQGSALGFLLHKVQHQSAPAKSRPGAADPVHLWGAWRWWEFCLNSDEGMLKLLRMVYHAQDAQVSFWQTCWKSYTSLSLLSGHVKKWDFKDEENPKVFDIINIR